VDKVVVLVHRKVVGMAVALLHQNVMVEDLLEESILAGDRCKEDS
jgi:hypothetical protein